MADIEGGYDLDFVDPPPDSLVCLICTCVAKDAQQVTCCGRVFCRDCLGKLGAGNCPHCRKVFTSFQDLKSEREVNALKVKCDHLNNGCQWVGELGTRDDHFSDCGYQLVECKYKCKNKGKVLLKELENHVENECPKRPYSCPNCKEKGEYIAMTTSHVDTCPLVEVQCPNLLCKVETLRFFLARHRSICEYERVPCKYAEIGCDERPMRKDLKEHENDNKLHLNVVMETVLPLHKKVKQLQEEKNRKIFKFTQFGRYKRRDSIFYSPPFYSSQNGYKMYISVDVNGDGEGEGEGTHVSVFAYLMKADNDDSLTWPFTGTVTVELLNQLEDDNHHKRTITFPADSEASKRVVDGERGRGYGRPKFIPHTDLDHKPDKNCQYLKDDTLIFRISVQVPDYKPWLEGTN